MDRAIEVQLATTIPLVSFFIPCDPPKSLSKNSKQLFVRKGRACMTDSKNTANAKSTILQLFAGYAPKEPLTGPLRLVIRVCYPFNKTEKKKVIALGEQPKVTRPDVDGIATGVMDCMSVLRFWKDDAQVTSLTVSKSVGPDPGICLSVEAN